MSGKPQLTAEQLARCEANKAAAKELRAKRARELAASGQQDSSTLFQGHGAFSSPQGRLLLNSPPMKLVRAFLSWAAPLSNAQGSVAAWRMGVLLKRLACPTQPRTCGGDGGFSGVENRGRLRTEADGGTPGMACSTEHHPPPSSL